jgi:hypothetical protein
VLTPDSLEAGVSESYGIQHASGKLGHTRRGVPVTGFERNRLGHDSAEAIEIHHPIQLSPEASGAGREKHRVLKSPAEQLSGEIRRLHFGSGTLDPPAEG